MEKISITTLKPYLDMIKHYNTMNFKCEVQKEVFTFHCYTTYTKNGFCHTCCCTSHNITDTKISYFNRTWESFEYQSVLNRAIDKLPKGKQEAVRSILIEGKEQEEREAAEKMFSSFKSAFNSLSKENKELITNSNIEVKTEGEAKALTAIMQFMNLTDNIK